MRAMTFLPSKSAIDQPTYCTSLVCGKRTRVRDGSSGRRVQLMRALRQSARSKPLLQPFDEDQAVARAIVMSLAFEG